MSINEKNANTASEELINIPVNLSADELIEIPANLSNNTSSSSTTYAGASSRAIGCSVIGEDNCSIMNQCNTAQLCNLCEIEGQGCSTTCEISCQSCEDSICESCMTTCERACQTCQANCQTCQANCQLEFCQTCQVGCQIEICQTSCQIGCQKCEGVSCQTCQNCEGVACQTTQTCTSGCQITCETSCEDTCETTCELSCQYACQDSCENCQGVSCQTCQNCEGAVCLTSCQNCQGVTCQTCQGNCEIESQRPDNWEWVSPVEAGRTVYYINNSPWYLTAEEWNRFTARINQFRSYRGLSAAAFTTAVQGQPMLALQANEAINAINVMNPSIAAPSLVSSNDPIMAQFINGLANSLNSLL